MFGDWIRNEVNWPFASSNTKLLIFFTIIMTFAYGNLLLVKLLSFMEPEVYGKNLTEDFRGKKRTVWISWHNSHGILDVKISNRSNWILVKCQEISTFSLSMEIFFSHSIWTTRNYLFFYIGKRDKHKIFCESCDFFQNKEKKTKKVKMFRIADNKAN